MESGRRVFVVDDEAVVLKALERMLRSNGFTVEAFPTAEALLERLPYDGIACVLIDLRMPGVSGLELQNVMSRRGLTMPIIFLSAHGDETKVEPGSKGDLAHVIWDHVGQIWAETGSAP